MSLIFRVAELRREISALKLLAREFLDLSADQVLSAAETALTQICQRRGGRPCDWTISESWPLRTAVSAGEFQPQQRNANAVHGQVSFIWQIVPVDPGNQKQPAREVALVGKASTKISIVAGPPEQPGKELAMWRVEVADDAAPGTYFHVQVLGRETDELFPHYVDIPRLPSAFVSPFACVEFIIGELFQDRWPEHANRDFRDVRDWHGVQSERLRRQLTWHLKEVEAASGSPWSAWKQSTPPERLFVDP
jgi:hypothetical protein